jgi:hypothetical protein
MNDGNLVASEVADSVDWVLATIRRPNEVCSFPAPRLHEDLRSGAAKDGIKRTKFTSPYSRYGVDSGNSCPFRLLHTFHLLRPARHYPRVRI